MNKNQPQQEFSQDHIVRRLISKFRKPSDAASSLAGLQAVSASTGTMQNSGSRAGSASSQRQALGSTLQVPGKVAGTTPATTGAGLQSTNASPATDSTRKTGQPLSTGSSTGLQVVTPSPRSQTESKSRWAQMVASAGAGCGKPAQASSLSVGVSPAAGTPSRKQPPSSAPMSTTRALLDVNSTGSAVNNSNLQQSPTDGQLDDELDENYFRPGGKGHQALLDNMDKRLVQHLYFLYTKCNLIVRLY